MMGRPVIHLQSHNSTTDTIWGWQVFCHTSTQQWRAGEWIASKSYDIHQLVVSFSFLHTGDTDKQISNSPLGPTPYTIWWCHASGICCCLMPCWRLRVAIGTAPAQQRTDQPLMALSEVTLSTHTSTVPWLLFFYIYIWRLRVVFSTAPLHSMQHIRSPFSTASTIKQQLTLIYVTKFVSLWMNSLRRQHSWISLLGSQ